MLTSMAPKKLMFSDKTGTTVAAVIIGPLQKVNSSVIAGQVLLR